MLCLLQLGNDLVKSDIKPTTESVQRLESLLIKESHEVIIYLSSFLCFLKITLTFLTWSNMISFGRSTTARIKTLEF